MKTKLIAAALAFATITAWAEDITALDGKQFSSGAISSREPDGLKITTSDGIEKILFSNLSPEVQQKYGYDPAKAAQYKQETSAADAQRAAAQDAVRNAKKIDETAVTMEIKVKKVTKEGAIANATVPRSVLCDETVDTSSALEKRTATRQVWQTKSFKLPEPVMIYGLQTTLVDGDSWSGKVWPVGVYHWGGKTLRAYATDKLQALKMISAQ